MSNAATVVETVRVADSTPKLSRQEERALLVSMLPRQGRRLGTKSLMVEIQAGDLAFNPPLFTFGSWWGDLAKHLDSRQAVYGLPVLVQAQTPETHVKALAALYLDEIRSVQPQGPYLLGGYCFGGWIAFEIAQRLQAQGETVSLLTLVQRSGTDPVYQRYQPAIAKLGQLRQQFASRWHTHQRHLSRLNWTEQLQYSTNLTTRVLRRVVSKLSGGKITPSTPSKPQPKSTKLQPKNVNDAAEQRLQVIETLDVAMENYRPDPYSGQVVLFFAREGNMRSWLFPHAGWGKLLTGKVEIHNLPGNHHTVLEDPQVQALAKKLRRYLA